MRDEDVKKRVKKEVRDEDVKKGEKKEVKKEKEREVRKEEAKAGEGREVRKEMKPKEKPKVGKEEVKRKDKPGVGKEDLNKGGVGKEMVKKQKMMEARKDEPRTSAVRMPARKDEEKKEDKEEERKDENIKEKKGGKEEETKEDKEEEKQEKLHWKHESLLMQLEEGPLQNAANGGVAPEATASGVCVEDSRGAGELEDGYGRQGDACSDVGDASRCISEEARPGPQGVGRRIEECSSRWRRI